MSPEDDGVGLVAPFNNNSNCNLQVAVEAWGPNVRATWTQWTRVRVRLAKVVVGPRNAYAE